MYLDTTIKTPVPIRVNPPDGTLGRYFLTSSSAK